MKTNTAGVDLIKEFESLRLDAYKDSVGIPTIGYGNTYIDNKPVQMGETCTKEQACEWLDEDIEDAEGFVDKFVNVPLNENQYAAVVSLVYNIGPGSKGHKDGILILASGTPSTFLKKLNLGDYDGAASEILRWNKAGGKILAGLTRRREAEKSLFSTPV